MACLSESEESRALINPGEINRRLYSDSNGEKLSESESGRLHVRLRVYKRRWYILFLFVVMNVTQNMFWNTFGPIQSPVKLIFHWKDRNILLLSLWAAISMVAFAAPMGWLMEARGLRVAVIVTCAYLVVGKCLQSLPFMGELADTILLNIGQIIVFMAGPICVGVPTAVSASWFPPNERTTATAIAAQSSYVGVAAGFLLGPELVPDPQATLIHNLTSNASNTVGCVNHIKRRFKDFMYIELAIAVTIFIAVLIYFPSKPKLPPSRSSTKKRHDFQASVKCLLRNWSFWLIAILFGMQFAVTSGWLSIIDVVLSKFDVDQTTAGWLGFGCSLAGIVSGVLISRFADYIQRKTKCLLLLMLIGGTISLAVFSLTCERVIPMNNYTSIIILYTSCILAGFFIIGLIPLFFEIGVECTYPVNEGICSVFMMVLANVCLLLFYIIFMFSHINLRWVNWVACGSVGVCIPGLLVYRERYIRLDVDTVSIED